MDVRTAVALGCFAAAMSHPTIASAGTYADRSTATRAAYSAVAMAANVLPGVSTIYAQRCLPGYVVCKLLFAGASLIAAGDQIFLSAGGDFAQARAILHRGFAGDWYLTGRHISGEVAPNLLPDPPASNGGERR